MDAGGGPDPERRDDDGTRKRADAHPDQRASQARAAQLAVDPEQ